MAYGATVKSRIIKLIEENTQENLYDCECSKDFVHRTTKAQSTKEKLVHCTSLK